MHLHVKYSEMRCLVTSQIVLITSASIAVQSWLSSLPRKLLLAHHLVQNTPKVRRTFCVTEKCQLANQREPVRLIFGKFHQTL